MQVFIIISILFGILYVLQIGSYIYGFFKLKSFNTSKLERKIEDSLYLSIIIPFKNEKQHLELLFQNLKNQSIKKTHFEVFFINDHSSDNSEQIISELIKNISNFNIISLTESQKGKKEAIRQGISQANGELIVTSDADCLHQPSWLKQILYFYLKHKPKMIIAPVLMTGSSFFQKNQSLEFLSLSGSTVGASGINHPTMCSGANLAYRKDIFVEFKDAMHSKETSGDDVFLMHNIKRKYAKDIHYLKSNKAVVYTEAEKSFNLFFKQRLRWVSKSKSYFDIDTIISSVLVLFINIFMISSFILSFLDHTLFLYFVLLFGLKLFIDFILLYLTADFFKQKHLLYYFPLLSFIYPFYIIITAILGLFTKKIKWKEKGAEK